MPAQPSAVPTHSTPAEFIKDDATKNNIAGAGINTVCPFDKINHADNWKTCGSIVSSVEDNGAVKIGAVSGRIVFQAGKIDSSKLTTEIPLDINAMMTGGKKVRQVRVNYDIILASYYQSNTDQDNSDTGKKWCGGAWSNTLTNDVSVKIFNGLSHKTKCTFQFIADAKDKAPSFTLSGMIPSYTYLLQTVEWADAANFDGNSVLNKQDSATMKGTPFYMASGDNTFNSAHATKTDVLNKAVDGALFFNPITNKSADADFNSLKESDIDTKSSMIPNPDNFIPGSLGNAIYYDRSTGINKDTIRTVDSYFIEEQIASYNVAAKAYNQAADKYNGDKKKYENTRNAMKKEDQAAYLKMVEEKTAFKDKPTMPWKMPAYSGPYAALGEFVAQTPKTWLTNYKEDTKKEKVTLNFLNAGKEVDPKKKDNTITYLRGWTGANAPASDAAMQTGVGKTFGRFGQGEVSVDSMKAPFIWQKVADAARPGMMVSIFPYDKTAGVVTADDKPITITAKQQAVSSSGLEMPSAPQTLTAIPAEDSAMKIAASLTVLGAVASTLF